MTKNNPLVSVIIPIFNTSKYLPTCLDSVIGQTYQNLEIILVDDGSTDNSYQIAKEYSKKDSRIKLIHQKNQGLSVARNTGIKKSTGSYITFVDSDDYIEPNMTNRMMKTIQNTNADIVCCSFKEVHLSGKTTSFSQHHPAQTFNTENALKAMLLEQGFMPSATMKLYPTKYFKNIEFPVGKLHEDVGTTYKLIMKADKIAFIPDEDYIYVHHKKSITSTNFNNQKFDLLTLTDQMCDDIDSKYPNLKNITNERRIRARFSILRQIPTKHPKTKELLEYIKNHRDYITKNPQATKTDKIALSLTLINIKLFQFAYKIKKA